MVHHLEVVRVINHREAAEQVKVQPGVVPQHTAEIHELFAFHGDGDLVKAGAYQGLERGKRIGDQAKERLALGIQLGGKARSAFAMPCRRSRPAGGRGTLGLRRRLLFRHGVLRPA